MRGPQNDIWLRFKYLVWAVASFPSHVKRTYKQWACCDLAWGVSVFLFYCVRSQQQVLRGIYIYGFWTGQPRLQRGLPRTSSG